MRTSPMVVRALAVAKMEARAYAVRNVVHMLTASAEKWERIVSATHLDTDDFRDAQSRAEELRTQIEAIGEL